MKAGEKTGADHIEKERAARDDIIIGAGIAEGSRPLGADRVYVGEINPTIGDEDGGAKASKEGIVVDATIRDEASLGGGARRRQGLFLSSFNF